MHHDIGVWISDIRLAVDEDVRDGAKDPVVRVVQVVIEKRQILTLASPDHARTQIKWVPPRIISSAVGLLQTLGLQGLL